MIQCIQNGDEYAVTIGSKSIIVRNVDDFCIWAECNLKELGNETGVDFPSDLNIDVMLGNDLTSVPFRHVALFKQGDHLLLECEGDGTWENPMGTNSVAMLHAAIEEQIKQHDHFVAYDMSDEDAACLLIRTIVDPAKRLADSIALAAEELNKIVSQAYALLSEAT
ncbi:MAG: hypothetical protein ACYC0X_12490 [Pirellulaceae bacterium]